MGRTVRDQRLDSRDARAKLKLRADREPYWRLIHEGLHIGYRKGKRGGVWIARWTEREADGKRYRKENLGLADDLRDADGIEVLSFRQAQTKAIGKELERAKSRSGVGYTVGNAVADYLEWFKVEKKSHYSTERAARTHILPSLGSIPLTELDTDTIKKWQKSLLSTTVRARSKRKAADVQGQQDPRARKATSNRILTILKAALNHAWYGSKAQSDEAWRRVKPYKNVDAPKIHYLSPDDCRRLINGCESAFRLIVIAALQTGCRYGEIVRLVVSDFLPDASALILRETKSGKPRYVYLTGEACRFFERQTAGKGRGDLIFVRDSGEPWGPSHQQRPLARACAAAGISPPATFHALRHTYASQLAMRGVPLQVIAEALGHADTRLTHRHYAHLLPSYVADTIRANVPALGLHGDNVAPLSKKRAANKKVAINE